MLQATLQRNETRILLNNARFRAAAAWNRLADVTGERQLPVSRLEGDLEENTAELDWETTLRACSAPVR